MSESSSSENLVSLNGAHCQLLAEQLKVLEARVHEMEATLIEQASRLHDSVSERLDRMFDENTIVEFENLACGEGVIKVTNPGRNKIATGRSREVFDTLNATREQLRLLNETIESMQLAR